MPHSDGGTPEYELEYTPKYTPIQRAHRISKISPRNIVIEIGIIRIIVLPTSRGDGLLSLFCGPALG